MRLLKLLEQLARAVDLRKGCAVVAAQQEAFGHDGICGGEPGAATLLLKIIRVGTVRRVAQDIASLGGSCDDL